MNSPVSWFDNFEIVDADDKDEFNVCLESEMSSPRSQFL